MLLRGNKLIAFDAVADERLQRTLKGQDSIASRLTGPLGKLGDAVELVLEPTIMQKFFADFRGFRDWDIRRNDGVVSLGRSGKGAYTIFRFSADTHLLREVTIGQPTSLLDWKFKYGPTTAPTLNIPGDARQVLSFTVGEAPPKYDSTETEATIKKMVKAYGGLRNGIVDVSGDEGDDRLWLAGRKLREEAKGFIWAYDGVILSIRDKKAGRFYRGKAARPILAEYITRAGGQVDPILRRIVFFRIPYQDLFPTDSKVNAQGSGKFEGVAADMVKVTTFSNETLMFIRKDNHLLASMETDTFDSPGKTQTKSTRKFAYINLGEAPSSSMFRLSPGSSKVQPLPKLPKSQVARVFRGESHACLTTRI